MSGFHESLDAALGRAGEGDVVDLSATIREYLTNETDVSRPSFHATALTHRILLARLVEGGDQ